MKYADQEELEKIALKYIELRNRLKKSKSKKLRQEFKAYQNFCIEKFRFLVLIRVAKYKKFSNYQDLEQDGFEALIRALSSYKGNKSQFTWWADKYISTRVARSANAHSTIKIPLKKARDLKPYKTSAIPVMIDETPGAVESLESFQTSELIAEAIEQLTPQQQQLVKLVYGLDNTKTKSINDILEEMSLSRSQYLKMLEEVKLQLKKELLNR